MRLAPGRALAEHLSLPMNRRRRPPSKKHAQPSPVRRQQPPGNVRSRVAAALAWRPTVAVEVLALVASFFFAIVSNNAFWHALLRVSAPEGAGGHSVVVPTAIVLICLQFMLLCLVLQQATAKPLLTLLLLVAAVFNHRASANGTYLDPEAMRVLLQSESLALIPAVSSDLTLALAAQVLVPAVVLWRLRILPVPWPEAIALRFITLVIASLFVTVAVRFPTDHVGQVLRLDKSIRYLVTPANVLAFRT